MAYGEKYYHEYCDRYGNTYRVSLRLKDYSGPTTEQDALVTPWKIERELPSGIKKGGILGTKATAYFLSKGNFTLAELYTAQEDTYQLVRYKNGVANWVGFVVPDGFKENNFDAVRSILEVSATDNLSTLSGKSFVDSYGDSYGQGSDNMQTFLWVIKEILKKTNILLPIKTLVDLKTKEGSNEVIKEVRLGSFLGDMIVYFTGDQAGAAALKNELVPNSTLKITLSTGAVETYTVVSSTLNYAGGVNWNVQIDVTTSYNRGNQNVRMQITPPPGTPGVPVDPSGYEDPLNVTSHDVRVWIRDSNVEGQSYYAVRGGAYDCYEVLNYIAVQWNFIVYQSEGSWMVKRWNIDKADTTGYQWFVYNTEGTFTGRQNYKGTTMVPCNPTQDVFRVYGSTVSMDRVFKHAITNYRYKYKQEGDSLVNLLNNGSLSGPFNPYPNRWTYYGLSPVTPLFPRTTISKETTGLPPGVTEAMRVFGYGKQNYVSNLTEYTITNVNQGDRLQFTWYEIVGGLPSDVPLAASFYGMFSAILYDSLDYALQNHGVNRGIRDTGYRQNYDLVNNRNYKSTPPRRQDAFYVDTVEMGGAWFNPVTGDNGRGNVTFAEIHRFAVPEGKPGNRGSSATTWKKVTITTDPVPMTGVVAFAVLGAASNFIFSSTQILTPSASVRIINPADGQTNTALFVPKIGNLVNVSLVVANFTMSKIVDPENDVVPLIDPFMYPSFEDQQSRNYTDIPEEIELLTGDDYGDLAEDRVSSMWYRGKRTTMWDSWDGRYGWSRQGLITAKSVMEMYWTPRRLINCEIQLPNISWETIFEIEELPGLKFGILRGEIAGNQDAFRGVLTEVFGVLDEPLPPGGEDGDNTTQPNWVPTGTTRCVKDVNNQNTGMLEGVERDINGASATYGQERWVNLGEDAVACPIGEAIEIFWGESVLPNPLALRYFPYTKLDTTYGVTFTGDDSTKILRLLHRADLGQVREITYIDGENSIGAWTYESDVTFNGTVYKSLKLEWVVGVFTELNVNFDIY